MEKSRIKDAKERFMGFVGKNEALCEYPAGAAGGGTAHFIVPRGKSIFSIDCTMATEDTLHRMLGAGFSDEEIRYLTGMEKKDGIGMGNEKWMYIDMNYYAPFGEVFSRQLRIVDAI